MVARGLRLPSGTFWKARDRRQHESDKRRGHLVLERSDFGRDLQQIQHLLLGRHAKRVNVPHAGAYVVGILELRQRTQQFHVRARSLDGNDIGIERRNRIQDVVELAVAYMSVNLGFVVHVARRQTKGLDRPIEILLPIGAAQWQTFAQRRFVNLNDVTTKSGLRDTWVTPSCSRTRLHLDDGNP